MAVTTLFNAQAPLCTRSSVYFTLEAVANITATVVAILGLLGRVQAPLLFKVGCTAVAAATFFNFQQKHIKARRVELIVQSVQLFVVLLAAVLIWNRSLHKVHHFSSILLATLSISLLCTGIAVYDCYARMALKRRLSRLDHAEVRKVQIGDTTGYYLRVEHEARERGGAPYRITSYNTACIHPLIAKYFNGMRPPVVRANEIGAHFKRDGSDVLCFQECMSLKATEVLVTHLAKTYSHILYGVAPFQGKVGMNSGFLIASHEPIEEADFLSLLCQKTDQFANKGALRVRIGNQNICVVHLLSDGSYEERAEQVPKVEEFLSDIGAEDSLVIGDFNLPVEWMRKLQLTNHVLLEDPDSPGTFYNWKHDCERDDKGGEPLHDPWNYNQSNNPLLDKRKLDHTLIRKEEVGSWDETTQRHHGESPPWSDHMWIVLTQKV